MITFRQLARLREESISEAPTIGKAYALGQGARHSSSRQKLIATLKDAQREAQRGISAADTNSKLDALLQSISTLAEALEQNTALSSHEINVAVSSVLLSDNLKAVLRKEISSALKKSSRR